MNDLTQRPSSSQTTILERHSDKGLWSGWPYGLCFAHLHNYTAASVNTLSTIHDADLYLCFNHSAPIVELQPRSMLFCPDILRQVALRPVRSMDVRGNTLYLYLKQDLNETDKPVGDNLNIE